MAVYYDSKADRLSLAVGDLLQTQIPHSSSTPHSPGFSTIGQEVHKSYQEKQAEMGYEKFETEKRIKHTLVVDSTEVILSGRIDNYWKKDGIKTVEEIKTLFSPLEAPLETDILQTQLYMWMLESQTDTGNTSAGILSYVSPDLTVINQFPIILPVDFEEQIVFRLNKLLAIQKVESNRLQQRAKQLSNLVWPFETYRENQEKLLDQVEDTISNSRNLIFESPTGSGKTAPVLYGSLLSALRYNCRIAFATSRTSQQKGKADFLFNYFPPDALGRILVLSSIEKFKRQSMESVGRFIDPLNPPMWFNNFLDNHNLFDANLIQQIADQQDVDAGNLQHELISRVDIIIGDQNLLANPDYRLHSWFTNSRGNRRTILIIDEAHGLPERLRENRSIEFSLDEIKWAINYVNEHVPDSEETLPGLLGELHMLFNQYFKNDEEYDLPRYDRLDSTEDLDSILYHIFLSMGNIPSINETDFRFQEFYDNIVNSYRYSQHPYYYSIFLDRENRSINWILIETSELFQVLWKNVRSTIAFSATLSPLPFSQSQLGLNPLKTDSLSLISNEIFSGLNTFRFGGINTRYRNRRDTVNDLCSLFGDLLETCEGDWLMFFPSREYLFIAEQQLRLQSIDSITITDGAVSLARILKKRNKQKPTIYLTLLGGTIAEGYEIPDLNLAGLAIVSLGIPPVSPRAELIRESSQLNDDEGRFAAYILPGLRKVQQAAGRLIRKPGQQGVLVLIDDRYADPEIESILPEHWLLTSPVYEKDTLLEMIRTF